MDPFIAIASVVAALAAAGGVYHSFHEMRATLRAELHLRALLQRDAKLRQELLDALSKREVGERTLEDLETRLSYLLMQMPRAQQPRVRAALKQSSKRGQRDYMLKLAFDETSNKRADAH